MALAVRRIVTGYDADGKAVVTTDERLAAVPRLDRPYISGGEIWSTDKMPADNSAESEPRSGPASSSATTMSAPARAR